MNRGIEKRSAGSRSVLRRERIYEFYGTKRSATAGMTCAVLLSLIQNIAWYICLVFFP